MTPDGDKPETAEVADVLALLAAGATGTAANRARTLATRTGSSPLARALATYLTDGLSDSVYQRPVAFEAFIRGGGNVVLYERVGAALAELYRDTSAATLLDIGCGDGQALIGALSAVDDGPISVDLIEPSPALLAAAMSRLAETRPAVAVRKWPMDLRSFLSTGPPDAHFDVVESTFALHTIPTTERTDLLRVLRERTGVLAVVEFDLPAIKPGSPAHLGFLAETYERGLAEYDADRDLVAQGFLMPVLTGQLAPGAVRSTWEQPAAAWREQVEAAGYTGVTVRTLFDYWSSPAFLLTASGG